MVELNARAAIPPLTSRRHTPVQDAAGVGSIDVPVSGKEAA